MCVHSRRGVLDCQVFALVRTTSAALTDIAANSNGKVTIVTGCDVTSDALGATLAASPLAGRSIGLLVNNAGGYGCAPPDGEGPMAMFAMQKLDTISMDVMRAAFELNTLGPLRVTKALLPQMADAGAHPKICIITSMPVMQRFAEHFPTLELRGHRPAQGPSAPSDQISAPLQLRVGTG